MSTLSSSTQPAIVMATDEERLRERIKEGAMNAPDEMLALMVETRRNALARQEEHGMPMSIRRRQMVMIEETVKVARRRGLLV